MFDHIIKINDKGAEIKLANKDVEMNLLGLHLVFEKEEKKVVCEIDLVNEDIVVAHFIGEIIDGKFYNGVIHKPDTNAAIRLMKDEENENLKYIEVKEFILILIIFLVII